MSTEPRDTVPFSKRLAYAAPAFALAVVGIPIYVYLPKFYTDSIGVDMALLGIIMFGVRIFDAVTDPAIGVLSDKTRTAFGRRRPYIGIGSLLLCVSIYFLFNPPGSSGYQASLWFAIWIFALFLCWTVIVVPYESLGPEITFDYTERIAIFSMRDGFLLAGTLAAASAPALTKWLFDLPDTDVGERLTFFWMALFYIPLILLTCWYCILSIKERSSPMDTEPLGFMDGWRRVGENRPFLVLLTAYVISSVGSNLPATLILYYVEYVLQSSLADLFLLLYFVTGIVFLPGWVLLARKIGKKHAWIVSMLINTGAFGGVFFLGAGDALLYGLLVFVSGIGFGATLALPSAIQADVIDYDELLTGSRREGQYIGLWSIAKKFSAAAGIGIGLFWLGRAGYQPNVQQPPEVILTLRLLYAGVPTICNLIAIGIVAFYPISGDIHRRIRAAIDARKVGKQVVDPLTQPPGATI